MPDVCTASPSTGKAFCDPHCKYLSQHAPNVPQGLKDFLKFCGAIKQGVEIKLTIIYAIFVPNLYVIVASLLLIAVHEMHVRMHPMQLRDFQLF